MTQSVRHLHIGEQFNSKDTHGCPRLSTTTSLWDGSKLTNFGPCILFLDGWYHLNTIGVV